MRIFATILALSALLAIPASAQMPLLDFGGGGAASAASISACPNQFVLDYSNSCALIGQGFGQ